MIEQLRQWWSRLPKAQRTAAIVAVPVVAGAAILNARRPTAGGEARGSVTTAGGTSPGLPAQTIATADGAGAGDMFGVARNLADQLQQTQADVEQTRSEFGAVISDIEQAQSAALADLAEQNQQELTNLQTQLLAAQQAAQQADENAYSSAVQEFESIIADLQTQLDQVTAPTEQTASTAPTEQTASTAPTVSADQPAATPAPSGTWYTIQSGDTLSRIALREYGDARKWSCIWNENKTRLRSGDPDLIYPGERIYLPASC